MEIKLPGFGSKKVTTKEIVIFTRQFATMIDSGLPLVQCLEILSSQQENKTFKDVLLKVKESVESGSTFADALAKHPKVFDNLFVSLVAAGEVGGILDTILSRLASVYREIHEAEEADKGGHGLPGHGHVHRCHRRGSHHGFRYSDLCQDVSRLWRGLAWRRRNWLLR